MPLHPYELVHRYPVCILYIVHLWSPPTCILLLKELGGIEYDTIYWCNTDKGSENHSSLSNCHLPALCQVTIFMLHCLCSEWSAIKGVCFPLHSYVQTIRKGMYYRLSLGLGFRLSSLEMGVSYHTTFALPWSFSPFCPFCKVVKFFLHLYQGVGENHKISH